MEQIKGVIGQEFLSFRKTTQRKIRWDCSYGQEIDGKTVQTPFEFYASQWRVQEPFPKTITMNVGSFFDGKLITEEDVVKRPELAREPLYAELECVDTLTQTQRFNPVTYKHPGPDYKKSGCGDIYFPIGLLIKMDSPSTLAVYVDWD